MYIELFNKIRPRVKAWWEKGYPGGSGITCRLLHHEHDMEEREISRFFFCQLEAIETLIWLAEMERREDAGCKMHDTGY